MSTLDGFRSLDLSVYQDDPNFSIVALAIRDAFKAHGTPAYTPVYDHFQ